MTLAITIIAPWNIWQLSDFRVVHLRPRPNGRWKVARTEDRSMKFVQLACRDGAAHLTYSGLAMVGNDHISDWVRRQVRGYSRTVDETLIRIREAATADLAGPAKASGVIHAFVVGAYVQRWPWAVAITNTAGPPGLPHPGPVRDRSRPCRRAEGDAHRGRPERHLRGGPRASA